MRGKKQFRVDHGKKEFIRGKARIKGIESFWGAPKPDALSSVESEKIPVTIILKKANLGSMIRPKNIYQISN